MKKHGILNGPLNAALGTLGHGHLVVIADCGLPLPASAAVVDLALVKGTPRFGDVLRAVLDDVEIEGSLIASEASGSVIEEIVRAEQLMPELVAHEELKALLPSTRLIIRTGEATPFANIVLRCGVTF
ncbi:D-ribose pyranase [Arthrobacter pigmenti]|uniref:D-ribose pyranase n=1 Tax=Arthrobacter pigmenti TaxID=271432 RepID=A0A846RKF6_9MICC|nr:D-ribose pyranase [Arthrobacter pigmenti]NJC23713.1 D-ribose pyranase [Arthrobacter pigmenti]